MNGKAESVWFMIVVLVLLACMTTSVNINEDIITGHIGSILLIITASAVGVFIYYCYIVAVNILPNGCEVIPEIVYGYACCDKCGCFRLHRILILRGGAINYDCLFCDVGKEKYETLEGVLELQVKISDEKCIEKIKGLIKDE